MKKTRKQAYVSDETFARIRKSFAQAAAHAKGEPVKVRETKVAAPKPPRPRTGKDIAALRQRYRYSQAAFARLINVSPRTVQAWEQGLRTPSEAALKLIAVADKHPEALLDVE